MPQAHIFLEILWALVHQMLYLVHVRRHDFLVLGRGQKHEIRHHVSILGAADLKDLVAHVVVGHRLDKVLEHVLVDTLGQI